MTQPVGWLTPFLKAIEHSLTTDLTPNLKLSTIHGVHGMNQH